jgi:hypothetical protein
MRKTDKEAIRDAIAVHVHFKEVEARLRAGLEARLAPVRALYEAAAQMAEAEFSGSLRECAEKIAASEARVLAILKSAKQTSYACDAGQATLFQASERCIEPEAFLAASGDDPKQFDCLKVLIGKAEKFLSGETLAAIVKTVPKGEPKLVIESHE